MLSPQAQMAQTQQLTPNNAMASKVQVRASRDALPENSQHSYFSEKKEAKPQYQSFFAKPLVLKSDLSTNAVRPHFNPSFLSPDFHNLSQGPFHNNCTWATHNTRRGEQIHGDPFNQFPKHHVHDDTANEKRRMVSAGRVPTVTAQAALEQLRSQTQVEGAKKHTYEPPKKTIPAAKDMVLVEAAGVPSNCSPYMHFQLRKYLRFPSANSTQKAEYKMTREGFGVHPKYKYEPFKYPDSVMRESNYGVRNMTEEQCKDYLETREQFRKTYHESVFNGEKQE